MFVIQHSGGALSSAGQGVNAGINTQAAAAEIQYREAQFQQERAMAEAQLKLTQQQTEFQAQDQAQRRSDGAFNRVLTGLSFQQQQEDRALGLQQQSRTNARADDALALDARQVAVQETQAAAELRSRDIQNAAAELGIDERKAEQAFNVMRSVRTRGGNPDAMKLSLEAAGQILGGGIGKGIEALGNMTETESEVFARLSPESQGRFLSDVASRQREDQFQAQLAAAPQRAGFLTEIGAITPDEQRAFNEQLAKAETEEEATVLISALEAASGQHVQRGVRAAARTTLLGRMAARRQKMAEALGALDEYGEGGSGVKDLQGRLAALDGMMVELGTVDTMPDIESFDNRYQALAKSLTTGQGGGDVQPPMNLDEMLRGAYQSEEERIVKENAPPVLSFDEWAQNGQNDNNIDPAVEFMDEILYSDMSEDEQDIAIAELGERFGFAVDDPGFLALVAEYHKQTARKENRGQINKIAEGLDKTYPPFSPFAQ